MSLFRAVLRYALQILLPVASLLSFYLYLYPAFHGCAFPSPENNTRSAFLNTARQHFLPSSYDENIVAPFRLLALGDPQLEGDSRIRNLESVNLPNLSKFWRDALLLEGTQHSPLQRLRHSLHDLIDFYLDDIPKALGVYRKRLDHVGNDYYLGHIYRRLHWWSNPTHVTVLGDLLGSQWVDDTEFESRAGRFWKRVFRHAERVPDDVAAYPSHDYQSVRLGQDAAEWKRRLINVAGNHDIGYAGDLSPERMERFVRAFGKANYELRFQLPLSPQAVNNTVPETEENLLSQKDTPEFRIVVLNDMNLDTPASSKDLQDETYHFLNDVIDTSYDVGRPAHFTIVLTHIPLYKEAGICVDGPFFDFFDEEKFAYGIKEQNHLSGDASKSFLEGIFGMSGNSGNPGGGMGRKGLIINGHDHEGCDIYHYINQTVEADERKWEAKKFVDARNAGIIGAPSIPGLQEVTVRSMMGDFGGNAGLLSLWFDRESWEWKYEFVNCALGTQHIWWVVHIVDLITIGVAIAYGIVSLMTLSVPVNKTKKLRPLTTLTRRLPYPLLSPIMEAPEYFFGGNSKLNAAEKEKAKDKVGLGGTKLRISTSNSSAPTSL
ncbi:hypothetical protein F5884DRAFT_787137 [Xylogone sp. PMI_703]|nr:hypothetical protein F5884DRAFT_787137 [Xylogone sp. PMI_703]